MIANSFILSAKKDLLARLYVKASVIILAIYDKYFCTKDKFKLKLLKLIFFESANAFKE